MATVTTTAQQLVMTITPGLGDAEKVSLRQFNIIIPLIILNPFIICIFTLIMQVWLAAAWFLSAVKVAGMQFREGKLLHLLFYLFVELATTTPTTNK